MPFILAEKIKMTQLPGEETGFTPVTVVEAGPMVITQIKTKDQEGYNAVVCGYKTKKNVSKPVFAALQKRLLDKAQKFKYLREFPVDDITKYNVGDEITVEAFKVGDMVKVQGKTKGKGFQGVVKRHHFRGASATHGTKHALREPGSIGDTGIQRVAKGKRMAGRTGGDTFTAFELKIVRIDNENGLLFINGALPGRHGTLLKIISK